MTPGGHSLWTFPLRIPSLSLSPSLSPSLPLPPSLVVLIILLLHQPAWAQDCVKDISDDICPQREGFDGDCERRCLAHFPLRISSGCHVRSSGTLLSFFGIRSFACRCVLPPSYCDANAVLNALSPARLHFSLAAIKAHSTIERLSAQETCPLSPSPSDLSCASSFSSCGWRRSQGADWFAAHEHGIMPFSPQEAPKGEYLLAVSKEGYTTLSIETCPQLCSLADVVVSVRFWRAPWVVVELCFKEKGAAMCAPVKTPNGRTTLETIPQTDAFSISIRFSNLTSGDAILVDDMSAQFTPCPLTQQFPSLQQQVPPSAGAPPSSALSSAQHPARILIKPSAMRLPDSPSPPAPALPPSPSSAALPPHVAALPVVPSHLPAHTAVSAHSGGGSLRGISRSSSAPPTQGEGVMLPEVRGNAVHTAMAVGCKDGDCRPPSLDRTCIGRTATIKCQAKCRREFNQGSQTARCVRESDYPFTRRCVCQPRRSPLIASPLSRLFEDSQELPHQPSTSLEEASTSRSTTTTVESHHAAAPLSEPSAPSSSVENLFALRDDDELGHNSVSSRRESLLEPTFVCSTDAQCETKCDTQGHAVCREGDCVCSHCARHTCDFEQRGECGWSDLRVLSVHFNNISVAAKKGQNNRYGLSRMAPRSYSGLLRRAPMIGPISLSVDLFPSHALDVKICVHTLQTCQSQRVEARAWNRVTAKIKMKNTDKIFLMFYNKAAIEKTIAIDNIQLESGECDAIPPKGVRRRIA